MALPLWNDVAAPGRTPQTCYAGVCRRYEPERAACRAAARYMKTALPQAARALVEQADAFLAGQMVLCGTMGKPFFVGNPPRWADNPVGDVEYVFQLNRMEHWPVLIHAYYLTGDARYARKVCEELENWIDTCPPLEISTDFAVAKPRFDAATPWRTLELGIRANRSWNRVLQLLAGEDCFTPRLFEKMMLSLYQHGEILYKVCPVLWPKADHNHYLSECLGLLEISCLADCLADAPVWRAHALHELERCARNQILPGGGQIEGAPNYHNECQFQMTYSIQLARRYGFAFSADYEALVHSMLMRSIYTTRPDGREVPWGDSDALPLVFRAAFCHYRAFGEQSALAAVAGGFGVQGLWEELANQVWELDDTPAVAALLKTLPGEPCRLPVFLHDTAFKQVMMRTAWQPDADSVFFSARSPIHNDHAHMDPNALEYCSHGFAVLPDAGRFTYREGGDRHYYKSTEAHNTLTVNGRDAWQYRGTWAYGPQRGGGILAAAGCGGWFYACGWHENYAPAVHRRAVILTECGLLVFDAVDGLAPGDLAGDYFLFDTVRATLRGNCFEALSPDGRLISTLAFCGADGATILPGRLSETVDHERNARRLCLRAEGGAPRRILSVVCCREAGRPSAGRELSVEETDAEFVLRARVDDRALCFAIDKGSWHIARRAETL